MLLQSETLYVYTAVIHDTMDKSNATYVTILTINTILYYILSVFFSLKHDHARNTVGQDQEF